MHVTFFPQQVVWLGDKGVDFHPWVAILTNGMGCG